MLWKLSRQVVVCAALLAAQFISPVAAASAQVQRASADSVSLKFAWPAETRLRVKAERVRETRAERNSVQNSSSSYDLTTARNQEGLMVAFSNFQLPQSGAQGANAIAEQLAALVPSYVVSMQGEFLRLGSIDSLRRTMEELFAPIMKDSTLPPQAIATMRSAMSDEFLAATAAQEWNALVGLWAGNTYAVGDVVERTTEEPMALFGGRPITMVWRTRLLRRMPCPNGGTELRCVELELRSAPDQEQVKTLLGEMFRTMAGQASVPVPERLDVQNRITLITEAHTMLPHSLIVEKLIEGSLREGATSTPMYQLDRRTYTYTLGRE